MAGKKKRHYSDRDKGAALAALDANEGNLAATSRLLGIPRATLKDWRDAAASHSVIPFPTVTPSDTGGVEKAAETPSPGLGDSSEVAEVRHLKKGELADRMEEVAHGLLETIFERVAGGLNVMTPLKDVATALGIVVDKMQVLRGKPDTIPGGASVVLTPEQQRRVERLRAIREGRAEAEPDEVEGVQ